MNITKASFYFVIYRISVYEHILMNKLLEVKKLIRVNIRVHVCSSYGKIHASNNNSWILPFSIFLKSSNESNVCEVNITSFVVLLT